MQVGVVARLGSVGQGAPPPRYRVVRQLAQHVEQAGFDSIWVFDHLLYRWPGQPTDGVWESWTMLSALAEATDRVELGTLVLCSPFRNPAIVAKMAVTLDEVSDGRLILGLGAGWHAPEFTAFGVPMDHLAGRLEEALQIVKPLLKTGRADFDGTYYRASDCEIVPPGPRPAGPPLLVAASRPRMPELAARYADAWNTAWQTEVSAVRARIDGVWAACDRVGRERSTLEITAALAIEYPELGSTATRPAYVGTQPETVAATLQAYAELGVKHAIVECSPFNQQALDKLADALERFRKR